MNNSKTPKIVVGVGLVAVYATVLTVATLRRPHDSVVVDTAPSVTSAQMVSAPAAPPVAVTESADAQVADTSAAVAPAPIAPEVTVVKAPEATRSPVAAAPKPRVEDVPVANLPSPRPPVASDAEQSTRTNSGTNAVSELAATGEAVSSETVTSAEDKSADEASESSAEVAPATVGN